MNTMPTKNNESPPANNFTRKSYRRENLNSLLEFARDNGLPPHQTQAGFKRFLLNLVSVPEKIVEIFQGEKRIAAGVLLDRVVNHSGTTPFELLGLDLRVAEGAYTALLDSAEKELAPKSAGLTLFHHFMHPFGDEFLKARGYEPFFNTYSMILRSPVSHQVAIEKGIRLEPLKLELFDFYYELVREIHPKNGNAVLPLKADFLKATIARSVPPLLLFTGTKLSGFVTISRDERDAQLGRIDSIGVLSSLRGKGFGGILLRQAIDALLIEKVTRITLDVSAMKPDELKLYESLGFQVIDRFAGFILRSRTVPLV